MVFIYAIKNVINNKIYIGSSKSIYDRKYKHFYELKNGTHKNFHLQQSYEKFGKDKFHFFILEECELSNRKEREIYWINQYNSNDRNHGYNIYEPNGDRFKCSDETKYKLKNSSQKRNISKGVSAYTIDLQFIKSFNSIKECAEYFNISDGIVGDIINGKRNRLTFKGKTFFKVDETPYIRKSSKQRNMTKFQKK